ncbi:hypothetical protein BC834DRAFT_966270 [Gloeopeniophorella convolvens]|nr:hypothetical protein BC834DRAFT_966270 [Gloeopeniophorella convolvens]
MDLTPYGAISLTVVLPSSAVSLPSSTTSARSSSSPLLSHSSAKSSLSHGAIAGIASGAVAFLLLLLFLALLCVRRKRRQRGHHAAPSAEFLDPHARGQFLPADKRRSQARPLLRAASMLLASPPPVLPLLPTEEPTSEGSAPRHSFGAGVGLAV